LAFFLFWALKGELLQLIWRWFWWCPRLHFMCITSL